MSCRLQTKKDLVALNSLMEKAGLSSAFNLTRQMGAGEFVLRLTKSLTSVLHGSRAALPVHVGVSQRVGQSTWLDFSQHDFEGKAGLGSAS